MKKVTIECSEKELRLLKDALEFYARVGIGQFDKIPKHPTFNKNLEKLATPKRNLVVGDNTLQGEILEIKDGKALINGSIRNGKWCKEKEWKDLSNVKLSCDYEEKRNLEKMANYFLTSAKIVLYGEETSQHRNWSIFSEKVHDFCRIAFDMYQTIIHEEYLDKSNIKEENGVSLDARPADTCKIAKMEIPNFKIKIENE